MHKVPILVSSQIASHSRDISFDAYLVETVYKNGEGGDYIELASQETPVLCSKLNLQIFLPLTLKILLDFCVL